MGILLIKNVGSSPRVDRFVTGAITGDLEIYLPTTTDETITITFDGASSGTKNSLGFINDMQQTFIQNGFVLGYLNSDNNTLGFRLQPLDINITEPVRFNSTHASNASLADASGNAYGAAGYDSAVGTHSYGINYYIPYEQILRVEEDDNDIKLYYASNKYIKFQLGGVDTTRIDRTTIVTTASSNQSFSVTTLTSSYFADYDGLSSLKNSLFEAISNSQNKGISELQAAGQNISVSNVTISS